MGLRFRKSIRLVPGLRMNLGLRGLSMTLGPRGSSVSVGARGTYVNVGIPGTGISSRTRIGAAASSPSADTAARGALDVAIRLQDDGTVLVVGEDGNSLAPQLLKKVRAQNDKSLRAWLEEKCDLWNKGIDELLGIHLGTPPPTRSPLAARSTAYSVPMPHHPAPIGFTLLDRLLRSRRVRRELQIAAASARHAEDLTAWERAREEHERSETARLRHFAPDALPDPSWTQDYLGEVLGRIAWPRETVASLEVNDTATEAFVDIDLPEIEDMPDKSATVAARGLKVNVKERSATQRRREYLAHVHGVVFRVIGEVFAALPRIERIVASGYSQRVDKSTGNVADDYLISVRVARTGWARLDFARLAELDVQACLAGFDLRRNMTATGVFTPIVPFGSIDDA